MYSTLCPTQLLAAQLQNPGWVIVDARFQLADPEYGHRAYLEGHIPGAVFADLNRDLSDPPGGGRGRHPLPAVDAIAAFLGRLGIDRSRQVIVYDDSDGMYASRLWWMLRWLGHDAVAVLDGGFAKWTAENRPLSSDEPKRETATFIPSVRHEMLVTATDVERMRLDPTRMLVDSRAPDRYRGENETIDPVAGHIPGARNRFFKLNVDGSGVFLEPDALRAQFESVLGGCAAAESVFYCGSGVTACHNLLALEHAGMHDARLYAGSWSEWISDPGRPVAVGDDAAPRDEP